MDNHCNQEYIKQFKEDLEKYSTKLPPGYASSDEKWFGGVSRIIIINELNYLIDLSNLLLNKIFLILNYKITDKLKDDLNIVKLRINTLSSIKSNKWEFILENEEYCINI